MCKAVFTVVCRMIVGSVSWGWVPCTATRNKFILQESIIDHFLFVQLSVGNGNTGTPGTPGTPETSGTIGNVGGGGPGGTLPDIGNEGSGTGRINIGEVGGVGGGSMNSYSQFITYCSVVLCTIIVMLQRY